MLDREWLSSLEFETYGGYRIEGLEAIGSTKIVFRAVSPTDGNRVVLKVFQNHLGFHIKEVPLFLSTEPLYDYERLNGKLKSLVGSPTYDTIVYDYDRLMQSITSILYKVGIDGLLAYTLQCPFLEMESLSLVLHCPGMSLRLEELAAMDASGKPSEPVEVNTPHFPLRGTRRSIAQWAREMRDRLREFPSHDDSLDPQWLPHNPLYVWGGAVIDGFFTDEELPKVVADLQLMYDLRQHSRQSLIVSQMDALGNLMACFLKSSEALRLTRFCAMAGYIFDVYDNHGNEVAHGLKLLE